VATSPHAATAEAPQDRIGLIEGSASPAWSTPIAGLSVLSRVVAALGRCGAADVYLLQARSLPADAVATARRELASLPSAPTLHIGPAPESGRGGELIVVTQPLVFDPRILDRVDADQIDDAVVGFRRAHEAASPLWLVGARRTGAIAAAIAADRPAATALATAETHTVDPGVGLCDAASSTELEAIERKLYAQARKTSDSWVARNVDRRVSLWLTRRLVDWPITPNQITLASTAIGLLGAILLGVGTYLSQLLGAALLTSSIIIDGCDGEVARIKFMESEFGRKLDFFLDNVVNVAAIFAVGAGFAWQSGQNAYLYVSAINALAAAAAVWPVYSLFFRINKEAIRLDAPSTTGTTSVSSMVEGMAGRDFAYAILALAVFGRAHWFAWICLGGMLGFLAVVSFLWLRERNANAG